MSSVDQFNFLSLFHETDVTLGFLNMVAFHMDLPGNLNFKKSLPKYKEVDKNYFAHFERISSVNTPRKFVMWFRVEAYSKGHLSAFILALFQCLKSTHSLPRKL